jgi:hypothetical protein
MSHADFFAADFYADSSTDSGGDLLESPPPQPGSPPPRPIDISIVPDDLTAYPEDMVDQSTILDEIIGNRIHEKSPDQRFNDLEPEPLKLSLLQRYYERGQRKNAVDLLSTRHVIEIDDAFRVPLGTGEVLMNTDDTRIDYNLTVANCIGLSSLLPNRASDHRFAFKMDLDKQPYTFKGKHGMLGFDPAGSMLFIGHCGNDEVFLAMAPNEFLRGYTVPCPPGHSTASSVMSRRHYRQVLMMIIHFLARLPDHAFLNPRSVYLQDLESLSPNFEFVTETMYVFLFHLVSECLTDFFFL